MTWAPSYASTDELREFVRIEDSLDDEQLQLAIATASRAIDGREGCNRQFGQVASAEQRPYTARWSRSRRAWLAPIDDLMTTADLVVQVDTDSDGAPDVTVAAGGVAGYVLRPRNAAWRGWPWTELLIPATAASRFTGGDGAVQVTARWGWTEVPDAIKEACLLQASRLASRRDSPYGVAGSPDAGSELRLLARLDPDVKVALEPYRRRAWVA